MTSNPVKLMSEISDYSFWTAFKISQDNGQKQENNMGATAVHQCNKDSAPPKSSINSAEILLTRYLYIIIILMKFYSW